MISAAKTLQELREQDENAIIEMVERNGEAWLAEMLCASLQVRADLFDGPEWRYNRLRFIAKEVGVIKAKIEQEDADENKGG